MRVAGLGCRAACPAEEIVALVTRAMTEAGGKVELLAAPASRAALPNVVTAAIRLGLPIIAVERDALAAEQARCVTHSPAVARATGLGSIAEAAALSAAGPQSRLLLARIATRSATCAIAA